MADDEPRGRWHGPLSPRPLLEARAFVTRMHAYTEARRADAGGCPVFKAHPGVRTVMVSGHAALAEVFAAPPEVLDREDQPGFGCLALFRDELLDGAVPALVSHQGNHAAARAFVDAAMELRAPAFAPACLRVLSEGWPPLRGTETAVLEEAAVETAAGVTFRWLADLDGPPGRAHLAWLRACFGLQTDTWITNTVARRLVPPPAQPVREYSRELVARIRTSAAWPELGAVAVRVGIPERDAAAHLLFAAGFNGAGGTYTTVFPALAQLHAAPALRTRLARELQDFPGDLAALDALPLLDATMHETMRLFGRPKHYYRRARVDLTLPDREGRRVRIPAGSRVGMIAVTARQDPTVFADPLRFDPDRYLADPALKAKVYAFGPPADGPSPYGCAGGANGTAPLLWKTLVAALARETAWRLVPEPTPDLDAPTGAVPDSLEWHRR